MMKSLAPVITVIACAMELCTPSAGQQLTSAGEAAAREIAVRVIADEDQKNPRVASGFVWPDQDHVVTALHVVAGDQSVSVEYPVGAKVERRLAKVERVLLSADLALLSIGDPVSRNPANPSGGTSKPNDLWVIGFPIGLPSAWSRHLLVSKIAPDSLGAGLEESAKNDLRKLGFPDLNLSVLRLDGNLVPGDSGAPIVNESGELVAIGSGGLRGGTIGLGWATFADELSRLRESTEPNLPNTPEVLSAVRNLFVYSGGRQQPSDPNLLPTFHTSFESVGSSSNGEINGFEPAEPIFAPCLPLSSAYTNWERSEDAKSGRFAVNIIPHGNPRTERVETNYCSSPSLSVSAAILNKVFDTSNAAGLDVSYFRLSTSNPRPKAVHNCDSSLSIYVSRDSREWEHYSAQCGEYPGESAGWQEMRFQIPALGAETMKLGFLYEVQNVNAANANAVYLLDDFDVRIRQ